MTGRLGLLSHYFLFFRYLKIKAITAKVEPMVIDAVPENDLFTRVFIR
ncbi:hypothetical protein [Pedobacter sp. B4-66]|nr:hypothetical protein [Pedobacter sp. B4-66]